jgi:peptidylprolyl isomerase
MAKPSARKTAPEIATPSGLKYIDRETGKGKPAHNYKKMTVHYTGTLENGKVFDTSKKSGKPFTFKLGAGEVIPGWDEGVAGMREGGTRTLTIPGHLAYGEEGVETLIPPNATLIFDVELISVK